jgi:hypothetical protein
MTNNDWLHDPPHADRRNFCMVEKWSRGGQHVEEMLLAGNNFANATPGSTTFSRSFSDFGIQHRIARPIPDLKAIELPRPLLGDLGLACPDIGRRSRRKDRS